MKAKLSELFYSIQGEGPAIGRPAIFVRMSQCNLDCVGCFGIKPGRNVPKVILSNGGKKRLDDAVIGDKILTFDEEFNLVETTVIATHTRLVDTWLEIVIDGKQYFVTEDHPFMTPRGIIRADNLVIGDDIYEVKPYDIVSFKKLGSRNPMTRPDVIAKKVSHTDYVMSGKKISKAIKRKQELGTYVHPIMSEDGRKRASESKIGDKNPNWKNINPNFKTLKRVTRKEHIVCNTCGSNKNIEIHHVDKNPENDQKENLIVVCKSCHTKIHKKGYNFWNGKRRDGKQLSAAIQHNGKVVTQIRKIDISKYYPSTMPDPLQVFNLTCEPYHTYLLDKMWVHNCDTPIRNKIEEVETISIINRILNYKKTYPTARVVITGGEPLLQPEAITEILNGIPAIPVDLETNGTISEYPELLKRFNIVVVSPKRNTFKTGKESSAFLQTWNDISKTGRNNIFFKFVVGNLPWAWSESEVRDIIRLSKIEPSRIWLMPAGENTTKLDITGKNCWKVSMRLGCNYSDRLQVRYMRK